MSPLKRIIENYKSPPDAMKSMSVAPVRVKGYERQSLQEARATFGAGLQRQGQGRSTS
ncbi:MAG TPA: hypothetical protein VN238_19085 [Solirubrobacteraceae bacterium]|nr:hypothetical protein [Solirubrobacteraceae bacterium]